MTDEDAYRTTTSLLAIDVGEVNTRAILFDVVDARYRFLAIGSSPTSLQAPHYHAGEGIRSALNSLEEVTGRRLLGENDQLIRPELGDGSGVDQVVATLSAGPPLKILVAGLLEETSLESACKLVSTTYAQVVETLSLNDPRSSEARLDAILAARPEALIIAGGTDSGANRAVMRMIEPIQLAYQLLLKEEQPQVLYAGNQALAEPIQRAFDEFTTVQIAPNLRPTLEVEQLEPAQQQLAAIYRSVRIRQIPGVAELDQWADGRLSPAATAFGRIIRFLSKVYDSEKGVLGIDVGASSSTVAAAFSGELALTVLPQLGAGKNLPSLLEYFQVESLLHWLPIEVSEDYVRDYIFNKSIYPGSLPNTPEDLAIEQALTRQIIRVALAKASQSFPKTARRTAQGLLPWFEPIVVAGSLVTHAPTQGQRLLLLLDGLQPAGVTTLVLDQNNLAAPLREAAEVNPVLAVQVLESGTFLSLGTVISPVAFVRPGTPVVSAKVAYESGDEVKLEVKQGTIEVIPLSSGKQARLHLQPLHRADVGMGGPGHGGSVRVTGGALGVIIDARGRPLRLAADPGRRRELYRKWLWTLGG